MRRLGLLLGAGVLGVAVLLTLTGSGAGWRQAREVEVRMLAGQYEFSPPRVRARVGDRVTFRLRTRDVTHGFTVEGTGVETTVLPGREARVTVPVERAGKLRYRCTVICGPLHPFMVGEIVVEPNRWPLWGGALALVVAVLASAAAPPRLRRPELTRWPLVQRGLRHRALQFALIAPNLLVFTVIVLAGLLGTATGATNFATIFVWLAWWGLLVLLLIPLGGRLWCAMCPIPAPGEWLARGAIVRHRARPLGLGRSWPRPLRNLWPAFVALLLLVLFGIVVTTRPVVTALLLLGFALAALVAHLVFDRRVFCRYLCPVGGLIGVYAMAAPLELRARDLAVCRACRDKPCLRGGRAYGCPTFQFPGGGLVRNTHCVLCTECVKACPHDNIVLRLRPFGADLLVDRARRADEAWIALLLLGTALAHSVVKLGPWGWIKSWANLGDPGTFSLYAALFLGAVLLLLPAVHLLAAWLSRILAGPGTSTVRRLFVSYAYALVPLSLGAWMAFTLAVVLPNLSYVPRVLSDPLGWGWDLLGTRTVVWTWVPLGALPWAQLALLLAGLWGSVRAGRGIVRQALGPTGAGRGFLPLAGLLVAVTWAFVALYFG